MGTIWLLLFINICQIFITVVRLLPYRHGDHQRMAVVLHLPWWATGVSSYSQAWCRIQQPITNHRLKMASMCVFTLIYIDYHRIILSYLMHTRELQDCWPEAGAHKWQLHGTKPTARTPWHHQLSLAWSDSHEDQTIVWQLHASSAGSPRPLGASPGTPVPTLTGDI